ncbi:Dihydrofolate reductase [Amycolatopsis lurida]|uniref:Dihydrofolate reductase n=1 Tax=Amycolatopsis lurida NRRL 2430 TaxID=1460371 RepID=A0A2P2G1T8_AMYLU|nr:dihydrofolate reductase family protein [Amycolatopsis lurida]KFU82937.1 dihydrofolate reductase [Amycolatopsis lurida NRRL 2430]SED39488.1 Dihydrofolate reductase [Amycolatopsis lurida]
MRELIVTENCTIDGVIELTGDWFSPGDTDPDVDRSDVLAVLEEQRENSDALLLGRVTFEDMRGYWPKQTEDTTGISAYLDSVDRYVVSSTLTEPAWQNTTVLSGEVRSEIEKLKGAEGKDIVTTGSISLVRALIAEGLVDEYRLFVYPVVAGEGRRLFEGVTGVPKLRLAEERTFASGIVLLRYRAASR